MICSSLAIADFLHRHPRRIAAAAAASCMLGAGGALAVANVTAANSYDGPLHLVSDILPAADLGPQIQILAQHELILYRSEILRRGDTAPALLGRLGIKDPEAVDFLRADAGSSEMLFSSAALGRSVKVEADGSQRLKRLELLVWPKGEEQASRLRVQRDADGFSSSVEQVSLQAVPRAQIAVIESSLFGAADAASLPDSVTRQVIDLFGNDIDFRRHLQPGDHFSVVYESLQADQEVLGAGQLISAEFVNRGKSYTAMWFQNGPDGKGEYYSFDGQPLRAQQPEQVASRYVRPLPFTRVTSKFGVRVHPITGRTTGHAGIDYGAPAGTPVNAAAAGKVTFAGVQGGYGKVIYIKHTGGQSTVYGHLSRIGVQVGQAVTQGQVIGAVGSTGMATGPHLHFEVRVGNQPRNPATLLAQREIKPEKPSLDQSAKLAFDRQKDSVRDLMAQAERDNMLMQQLR